jgi:hypothetical protein
VRRPSVAPLRRVFSRIIPRPLRKGLSRLKLALVLTARRQPKKGAVAVVGLFRSVIGLGEGARLAITALRKLRINASAVDITSVLQPQERLDTKLQPSSDIDAGGILIVYVNPPEFPIARLNSPLLYWQ